MSTAKAGVGIAGILVIAAILSIPTVGIALHEFRAKQRAQEELLAANQDYAARLAQLRVWEQKAQAAEKERAELRAEADERNAAAAAALAASQNKNGGAGGSKSGIGAKGLDPMAEGQKFLSAFPQARALFMESGVAGVRQEFSAFFRRENMTPGQIDQFTNLIQSTWVNDLAVTPTQWGAGPDEPTQDQLSAILGAQGAQDYQNYNQTLQYPYKFTDLAAAAASLAGAPISDQQSDQIAQILANNSAPYQTTPGILGPGNWNTVAAAVNWDAAIAQTKAILSPAQFQAVQGSLLNLQFNAAMSQAQQSQSGTSPNP